MAQPSCRVMRRLLIDGCIAKIERYSIFILGRTTLWCQSTLHLSYTSRVRRRPRRPSIPSFADLNAAAGGVATRDRALSVLAVFPTELPRPTLADFAARTRIPKSTVLRMLSSLEHAHVVLRQPDGRYALGRSEEHTS